MNDKGNTSGIPHLVWNFFASIRLTVVVLLVLAATSIIGTLIPQNQELGAYLQSYGETLFRIFYTFDLFDMYRSWWFQFLILMLTANIIVCSIDRLVSLRKILFVKNPKFRLSMFQKSSSREEFKVSRPTGELKDTCTDRIRRRFRYVRTEPTDNGYVIFAEKGRWTRLGVYIVHLSVIFLLVGALIGSLFGFDGFVNIPEGETVDTIRLRNSNQTLPLDFAIRCENFEVSFYPSGMPKEYRSHLVIIEDGQPVFEKDIIVNDPLRYSGVSIYQSSYGPMPPDTATLRASGVTLSAASRDSNMVYSLKAMPGEPVKLPEGRGTFTVKEFMPSYLFMGQRDLGETLYGVLTPPSGEPVDVYLPLRFPRFDRMRQGNDFIFTVQGYEERFYTGLQVNRDPGVPLVYLGFVMMIVGCYITFFMSHQRLAVEVTSSGKESRIAVAGTANKNPVGMKHLVQKMSRELAETT